VIGCVHSILKGNAEPGASCCVFTCLLQTDRAVLGRPAIRHPCGASHGNLWITRSVPPGRFMLTACITGEQRKPFHSVTKMQPLRTVTTPSPHQDHPECALNPIYAEAGENGPAVNVG